MLLQYSKYFNLLSFLETHDGATGESKNDSQIKEPDLQSFIETNLSNNPRRISTNKRPSVDSSKSPATSDCGIDELVESNIGGPNNKKNHKGLKLLYF